MRWSNSQSTLIKKSEETSADVSVLEYRPQEFNLGTPEAALDYLVQKKKGSDFVLSDVLRATTGLDKIEQQSEEEKIENIVLERVAELQKQAYDEGFKLGRDEGLQTAFQKKTEEIQNGLDGLKSALMSIETVKQDLISQNEVYFLKLVYQIAEKIAYDHIQENPEVVLNVIKKSIEIAQADQDITVLISNQQLEFLENLKKQNLHQNEFLKNVKLQATAEIQPGGCIIQTNYGEIDAQIEKRTDKLWSELKQALPKIKKLVG